MQMGHVERGRVTRVVKTEAVWKEPQLRQVFRGRSCAKLASWAGLGLEGAAQGSQPWKSLGL